MTARPRPVPKNFRQVIPTGTIVASVCLYLILIRYTLRAWDGCIEENWVPETHAHRASSVPGCTLGAADERGANRMKRRRKAGIRSGASSLPSRKLLRSITSRGRSLGHVLRKAKPRRHHSEKRGVIQGVRNPSCQMSSYLTQVMRYHPVRFRDYSCGSRSKLVKSVRSRSEIRSRSHVMPGSGSM